MPVYHFTFHAYRSWNCDHERGWVQHDSPGIQRPNQRLAAYRDSRANFSPVTFNDQLQQVLIDGASDICSHRDWKLYVAATDTTHVHLVVSWREALAVDDVRSKLKQLLGLFLARECRTNGRPYFSHDDVPRRVRDRAHLYHLMYEYLPDHAGQFWRLEDLFEGPPRDHKPKRTHLRKKRFGER